MRNLSLAGADRFSTSSCWRRNASSASRAACNLNNPTANPPSSFKRSSIPVEGSPSLICATPDEILVGTAIMRHSRRRGATFFFGQADWPRPAQNSLLRPSSPAMRGKGTFFLPVQALAIDSISASEAHLGDTKTAKSVHDPERPLSLRVGNGSSCPEADPRDHPDDSQGWVASCPRLARLVMLCICHLKPRHPTLRSFSGCGETCPKVRSYLQQPALTGRTKEGRRIEQKAAGKACAEVIGGTAVIATRARTCPIRGSGCSKRGIEQKRRKPEPQRRARC